jgi:hypothetical protein
MRNAILNTMVKIALISSGVLGVIVWGTVSQRLLSLLLGIALVVAHGFAGFRSRRKILIASVCAWVAVSVSPLELSLHSVPGLPRVVPLVMGTLTEDGLAAEKRGEFVGGGCMVSGFEPRWVVAW